MSDDRIVQKYEDLKKAFFKLKQSSEVLDNQEIARNSTILLFEITFELWWKFLQCYMEKREMLKEYGPASTIKQAFSFKIIDNGEEWMNMLRSRNLVAHTYNENIAEEIYNDIKNKYINTFSLFITRFDKLI